MTNTVPATIDDTIELLKSREYVAGRDLGTVVFLALKMGRPLFLEGEAGVGKSALIEGLALRIIAGLVPDKLRDTILNHLHG